MNTAEASAWLRRIYQESLLAPARDSDFEPLWEPGVLCGAISSADFLCLLEGEEDSGELRWEYEPFGGYDMGRVVMHSVSTVVHKSITRAIVEATKEQLVLLGEDPTLGNALRRPVSLVCQLRTRLHAPDDALVPADASKASLPTLVIEVAFLNESLLALQTRLTRWMTETSAVQVAMGVKVFSNARRMLVLMERGVPTQTVDFTGRSRPGVLSAVVTFPLSALFHGFALPEALRGQGRQLIVVDADHLRAVIQKAQRLMKRLGVARLGG